jgi:hypothetical protein
MHEGLSRLKAIGAGRDPGRSAIRTQGLAKVDADEMVDLIGVTAKKENVGLFRRFAVMRHWRQVARIPYEKFLSPDELHMNDWSYGCIAKLLAGSIAETVQPLDADGECRRKIVAQTAAITVLPFAQFPSSV